MVLMRVCPWCRRTEAWRRGCVCLPEPPDRPLSRTITGIDRAVAVHPYDPVVRRFLLAAKNGGREDLLRRLGVQLASVLAVEATRRPDLWSGSPPTVVWVPASRDRRRRRGYDQGRVLARVVARTLGLPIRPLLARAAGEAQEGRTRADRLRGPTLHCRIRHAPRNVVLVDDVITTGASLATGAAALRRSGTMTVFAVAVASSGQDTAGHAAAGNAGSLQVSGLW